MQLQMLLTGCSVGYLAVASPNLEVSGRVNLFRDTYDEAFLLPLIKKAEHFW